VELDVWNSRPTGQRGIISDGTGRVGPGAVKPRGLPDPLLDMAVDPGHELPDWSGLLRAGRRLFFTAGRLFEPDRGSVS